MGRDTWKASGRDTRPAAGFPSASFLPWGSYGGGGPWREWTLGYFSLASISWVAPVFYQSALHIQPNRRSFITPLISTPKPIPLPSLLLPHEPKVTRPLRNTQHANDPTVPDSQLNQLPIVLDPNPASPISDLGK